MWTDEDGREWFDLADREDREAFVRAMDALPVPGEDDEDDVGSVAAQGE